MNAQNITQSEKILNPTNISNGELNQKIDFLYNELMKIKRKRKKKFHFNIDFRMCSRYDVKTYF